MERERRRTNCTKGTNGNYGTTPKDTIRNIETSYAGIIRKNKEELIFLLSLFHIPLICSEYGWIQYTLVTEFISLHFFYIIKRTSAGSSDFLPARL